MEAAPQIVTYDLEEMKVAPTAALFEGKKRAGIDISFFVVHTPPGEFVEMHVHPYWETFVMLGGRGRWTAGDAVTELTPEQVLVVPADTPHGFRNIGDEPLLVTAIHESGTLQQEFLGYEPK
ncbi:MAG TPA: cupin domain-containing protein [Solirubrobacterales bacterium]